jgi:hypothetical protein
MARGEDTSRHPGRQVGRLAHLMATQANRYWERAGGMPDETPEGLQNDLDGYRTLRDSPPNEEGTTAEGSAKTIGRAFKNRHNDNYAAPAMPIGGTNEKA